MTEEWLSCSDPVQMLAFLQNRNASDRKFRLFAAACCRRIRELMPDPRCWVAVEMAELYADGKATEFEVQLSREETRVVHATAQAAYDAYGDDASDAVIARAFQLLVPVDAGAAAQATLELPASAAASEAALGASSAQEWTVQTARWARGDGRGLDNDYAYAERPHQADLLRDIFGDPFVVAPFDPSWRTTTVVALANQMYVSRDFSLMPILGDALLDAGCDDQQVLEHCRHEGEHHRGCWVVDLVLDKT